MPVQHSWHDESARIMWVKYTGHVRLHEIEQAIAGILTLLDEGPTHFIVTTNGSVIPMNVIGSKAIPNLMRHRNALHFTVVQDNAFVQYVAQLVGRGKVTMCRDFSQAVDTLYTKIG